MSNAGNVELFLRVRSVSGAPKFDPPKGFSLRRGASKEDWLAIQTATEPFLKISETGDQDGSWTHEFGPGEGNVPPTVSQSEALANQFFIVDDASGQAAGTATAFRSTWHPGHKALVERSAGVGVATDGLVHWVAVRPDYQGRGLSKPLMSAVLAAHAEMGCRSATLETSSGRPGAVALYLQFGFEPFVDADADRQAWKQLLAESAARAAAASGQDERALRSSRLIVERVGPVIGGGCRK